MNAARYETMHYNRTGKSGLMLPAISLGLWHNFGSEDSFDNMTDIAKTAFDCGITHFDLANNYGPVPGSAEQNFGKLLKTTLQGHRDELVISTKAGYTMWPGPYGDWGSRKYLLSSLDQSLKRMDLDYVDIFYHHRPDPNTPLEETMGALHSAVQQGKALYVGISNYDHIQTQKAVDILNRLGTPLLIHQPRFSMFDRWIETHLIATLEKNGVGSIAFSPLAQGLLTDRYLKGVPADSRAAKASPFLQPDAITEKRLQQLQKLNAIAQDRGQTLAQLSLMWALKVGKLTSVLIGASRSSQIIENVQALKRMDVSAGDVQEIDSILR